MGDKQKQGGGEGGLIVPGSKCNRCGKNRSDQNGTLGAGACECRRGSDCSIRLGPVPDSAFRPPSPLPPRGPMSEQITKEEIQSAISGSNAGGTKYEIVSIREKHGQFRKAIPCMPIVVAILCCLLNVVLPGTGTFIAGLTVLCGCTTEHESKRTSLAYNMVAALLQLVTCPLIVGWIWSVLWGITFVNVSATKGLQDGNTATPV